MTISLSLEDVIFSQSWTGYFFVDIINDGDEGVQNILIKVTDSDIFSWLTISCQPGHQDCLNTFCSDRVQIRNGVVQYYLPAQTTKRVEFRALIKDTAPIAINSRAVEITFVGYP